MILSLSVMELSDGYGRRFLHVLLVFSKENIISEIPGIRLLKQTNNLTADNPSSDIIRKPFSNTHINSDFTYGNSRPILANTTSYDDGDFGLGQQGCHQNSYIYWN
jgi:hypothetical protein